MRKQMKKTAILLIAMIVSIGYVNAQFWKLGETGNGNVVLKQRKVNRFEEISAASGLNVYIRQGEKEAVTVETDNNLQDNIITVVEDNRLRLYVEDKVKDATKFNVYVTFKELKEIAVSSGADLQNKKQFNLPDLKMAVSSGASLYLDLSAKHLNCSVSSGASAKLKGDAILFKASASSGGHLNASKLKVQNCQAKASSGANMNLYVLNSLEGRASSGGSIDYSGNPKIKKIKTSSGGHISRD